MAAGKGQVSLVGDRDDKNWAKRKEHSVSCKRAGNAVIRVWNRM